MFWRPTTVFADLLSTIADEIRAVARPLVDGD